MTIREALLLSQERLSRAGIPPRDARLEAQWLLGEAVGCSRLDLILRGDEVLSEDVELRFDRWVEAREQRCPLGYILGWQMFMGLSFYVTPDVLLPRQDTELLVEWALELLRDRERPRVADIGTGSGAIALSVAHSLPHAIVDAVDISEAALRVAERNRASLGCNVTFYQGDCMSPLPHVSYDLIVSNPPYIVHGEIAALQPEVRHEPALALDGGEDGLDFYRRLAKGAPDYLFRGGWLLLEIGSGQQESVCALLRDTNCYDEISSREDLTGCVRMVAARRNC